MDSSTPFYQQLGLRFFALFLVFVLTVSVIVGLLYSREQQLTHLLDLSYPKFEQSLEQQRLNIESERLLTNLVQTKKSGALYQGLQTLVNNISAIRSANPTNSRELERLLLSLRAQQNTIKQLSANENRNTLLLESASLQLQLVLDELSSVRADLLAKQNKLFQQIDHDKVTDKVTTSRAKAYIKVSSDLEKVRVTYSAVDNVHVLFSRLTLQYPLDEFDFHTARLSEALQLWQQQFEAIDNVSASEQKNLRLLLALQNLLFTEQSVMAKWRGHLRVAQEFFAQLNAALPLLQQNGEALTLPKVAATTVPVVIAKLLPNNFRPSEQQYYLALLALLVTLASAFIWLLLRVRLAIKSYETDSVTLVKQRLSAEQSQQLSMSLGQREISQLLETIVTPEHSEQDYQTLAQQFSQLQQCYFERANIVAYISNSAVSPDLSYINQLLFNDANEIKSWRHAFTLGEARALTALAKQARLSQQWQSLQVTTKLGRVLDVCLNQTNEQWQVVISANDALHQLQLSFDELEQHGKSQQQAYRASAIGYAQQLSQMIVATMLQNQSASISSAESSLPMARQLNRMFDWCRQLQLTNQLIEQDHSKALTDVYLHEQLAAIVSNITWRANLQRNEVLLNTDPQLLLVGKINPRWFERLLTGLAKACLQDVFNSSLMMDIRIIDKNAGQQIVRFAFSVSSEKTTLSAPKNIQALADLIPEQLEEQSLTLQYLAALLNVTHSTNVQISDIEHGFELSFDMPIAYATTEKQQLLPQTDLKEANVIIFSDHSLLVQQLTKIINNANGVSEQIVNIEHLLKQLTTKHLNKYACKALILTSETLKEHQLVLQQHLHGLAKPLRPKVMVLQSPYNSRLHNEGLFEHSRLIISQSRFVSQLEQFIKGEAEDNVLISSEVLSQYRYQQTQVEVLLAVHAPEQHQQLVRLLYWLGVQVHVVCHAQAMLKRWQSGRYLVLISEFETSPFVELAVGKNVSRGVFTLGDKLLKDTRDANESTAQWHSGLVTNVRDVEGLIRLLSPWLKAQYRERTTDVVEIKQAVEANAQLTKAPSTSVNVQVKSTKSHLDGQAQLFDLAGYVRNQGSPELAVFMLDDYLDEITLAIADINQHLANKDYQQATAANSQLVKLSHILVVQELITLSANLAIALEEKSLKRAKSIAKAMTTTNEKLTVFAQAI